MRDSGSSCKSSTVVILVIVVVVVVRVGVVGSCSDLYYSLSITIVCNKVIMLKYRCCFHVRRVNLVAL